MANRAKDWLAQTAHDLDHAKHARESGHHDWACFAAQQAAEKALKGLFLGLGGEAWGHSLTLLVKDLTSRFPVPEAVDQAARRLDKHYIPFPLSERIRFRPFLRVLYGAGGQRGD